MTQQETSEVVRRAANAIRRPPSRFPAPLSEPGIAHADFVIGAVMAEAKSSSLRLESSP